MPHLHAMSLDRLAVIGSYVWMMRKLVQGNHKLISPLACAEAIETAVVDDPVTLERDAKGLSFFDASGRLLGTLTSRHAVAKRLNDGDSVVHCCVAWKYGASDDRPQGLLSVRVATGDPDDPYVQWCAANIWGQPREPRPQRSYATNIVGESHYQAAIARCQAGDPVLLCKEVGNPHDERAIVVKTLSGETIGYLPRTSWLQRVIHDEGHGARATIKTLYVGPLRAVVLDVAISSDDIRALTYQPSI